MIDAQTNEGSPEAELKAVMDEAADFVRRVAPRVTARTGNQRTDAFPLSIYTTFSRSGDPIDEDLVITVDVYLESQWTVQIDISKGDGLVLSEEKILCSGAQNASAALALALPNLTRFLRSSGAILVRELAKKE